LVGDNLYDLQVMKSDGSSIKKLLSYAKEGIGAPLSPAWSPVPGLQTGVAYAITGLGENLKLRDAPSLNGAELKKLKQGDTVAILDGPVQADDYYWWKMRTSDGTEGWAVDVFGWYQKQ
jgi:hypothetical protein